MKCIIPGQNVKVFGRAIHSLSRIGEELYVEPLDHGLALRTVNSSRSAYACIVFAPSFFQHYDDGISHINSQESDEEPLRCKVGMKSCLAVFKSLSNIEKTVERCKITLNMKDARLVFQMYCKHGIVKTHNLAFIECETLQAVFSKDLCPNVLTAQSRLLSDVALNFQANQEEVTLLLSPGKVCIKNYTEDEPDPNKVVHTELNLDPEEFDNFQVGVDSEVTFCLKELRAILAFSESANLPITICLESAGKPIVFSIASDPTFEVNFVLATLAPEGVSSSQRQANKSVNHAERRSSKEINGSESQACTNQLLSNRNREKSGSSRKHKIISERFDAAYLDLMNDDLDDVINQGAMDAETSVSLVCGESETLEETSEAILASPVIPMQHSRLMESTTEMSSMREEQRKSANSEDDDGDVVAGTPPKKKFKSLFFGLSQASMSSQHQTSTVLAEDTDDEDS